MEPYRAYGRGSCNRNMNSGCNHTRPMCNQEKPSCPQERMMNHHHHHGNPMMNQSDDCKESKMMSMMNSDCNCKDDNPHMRHFTLGMGYVPMQQWGELYDLETGFCQGTIFPDLNFVFCGSRGKM